MYPISFNDPFALGKDDSFWSTSQVQTSHSAISKPVTNCKFFYLVDRILSNLDQKVDEGSWMTGPLKALAKLHFKIPGEWPKAEKKNFTSLFVAYRRPRKLWPISISGPINYEISDGEWLFFTFYSLFSIKKDKRGQKNGENL